MAVCRLLARTRVLGSAFLLPSTVWRRARLVWLMKVTQFIVVMNNTTTQNTTAEEEE